MEPTSSSKRPSRKRPEPADQPKSKPKEGKTSAGHSVTIEDVSQTSGVGSSSGSSSDVAVRNKKRAATSASSKRIYFHKLKNIKEVLVARKSSIADGRVVSGISRAIAGEKGAFAGKDFNKNELIGFYEGKRVFRKRIPVSRRSTKKARVKQKQTQKPKELYVVWQRNGKAIEFLKKPDRHVAWTGCHIYQTGVEVGVDAEQGGSDIRYINHDYDPNVVLETLVDMKSLAPGALNRQKLLIKTSAETFDDDMVLVAAYARREVKAGDELFCNYKRYLSQEAIAFESVGKDIAAYPEGVVEIDGFQVSFQGDTRGLHEGERVSDISVGTDIPAFSETSPASGSDSKSPESPASNDSDYQPEDEVEDWAEFLVDEEICDDFRQEAQELYDSGKKVFKLLKTARDSRNADASEEALKAYLFLSLLRFNYAPDTCREIWKNLNKTPPIGKYGDSGWKIEVVFQMLIDHHMLSRNDKLRMMPIAWLANHPEYTEKFICTYFKEGRYRSSLAPKFNQAGLKPPQKESWTQVDIDQVLIRHGLLDEVSKTELETLSAKAMEGDLPANLRLFQLMRAENTAAICIYVWGALTGLKAKHERKSEEERRNDSQPVPKVISHLVNGQVGIPVGPYVYPPSFDALISMAEECPFPDIKAGLQAELQEYEKTLIGWIKEKRSNGTREWLKRIGNPDTRALIRGRDPNRPKQMLHFFLALRPHTGTSKEKAPTKPLNNHEIPKFLSELSQGLQTDEQKESGEIPFSLWNPSHIRKFLEVMGDTEYLKDMFSTDEPSS